MASHDMNQPANMRAFVEELKLDARQAALLIGELRNAVGPAYFPEVDALAIVAARHALARISLLAKMLDESMR